MKTFIIIGGFYESGVVYNVGGGYIPGTDTDQYYASVGIGFKFNSMKDLTPTKVAEPLEVKPIETKITPRDESVKVIVESNGEAIATKVIKGFPLNSSQLTKEMKKKLDKAALEIKKKGLKER